MRPLDPDLQARLDGGATTLCRCWRITRADGVALGFTDHDEAVAFDGVAHEAAAGLDGAAVESATGLAADETAIMGALTSDRVSEEDVAAGRFDGAEVRLWLVDWREPRLRHLLFRGEIGRIERRAGAFTAEVLGVAAALNRPMGRACLASCDAAFGDGRCGVDATAPAYAAEAEVAGLVGDRDVLADGLEGFSDGWFSLGRARWLTGANAGLEAALRAHDAGAPARLAFWAAPAAAPRAGDRLRVVAGCDKRFETCRDRFANALNFRGFPHIPGEDWVASYPVEGEVNDGGARHG